MVGMHSFLHEANLKLLELVEQNKDEIDSISIAFNYPKDPHDPGAKRVYDTRHGGVMLDLGIYVFEQAR